MQELNSSLVPLLARTHNWSNGIDNTKIAPASHPMIVRRGMRGQYYKDLRRILSPLLHGR